MKDFFLIFESATSLNNSDYKQIQESIDEFDYVKGNNSNKNVVKFKTKLQTIDEVNGNNRIYSRPICEEIVKSLSIKVKGKNLFQEIDHPMISGSPEEVKRRAMIVEIKNSGSIIKDIKIEGNDVVGIVETLSGFRGPDLRNLILDNVGIGFSLRMFGRLEPHKRLQGVNEVATPLQAITYDVVSNPSHSSAKIISFVTEGKVCGIYDINKSEILTESTLDEQLLVEGCCLPDTSGEDLKLYIEKLIHEQFLTSKALKFNI